MAVFRLQVEADITGLVMSALPYVRRVEFAQAVAFDYDQADGGGYVAVPLPPQFTTIQGLVVRSDKDITLRVNGQTDAGIPLKAGGLVVIFDAEIVGAEIDNSSGDTASIDGAVLGA